MSLPTLAKTWQFKPNLAITATGTALGTNRTILLAIKNALINTSGYVDGANASTTPSNMWTVRYSCNSVTAGSAGDGVDYWSTIANLVFANAGSAHSWIVLRNTAIDTNCELLLSCEGSAASGQLFTAVLSPSAGFTGGSTTAKPTATDQVVFLNNTNWGGVISTDANAKLDIWKSSDGQCWRFAVLNGGVTTTLGFIDLPVVFDSTWTKPATALWLGATSLTSIATNANLNTSYNFYAVGAGGTTLMNLAMTMPYVANVLANTLFTGANDLSSAYPFIPHQLASNTVAGKGIMGYLNDVWWGLTVVNTGDMYPSSGTLYQFVQLGSLIFPWCQTPIITS